MENSLPRTNQNPNRFRLARNVQPTVEGEIIPRSSYETANGQPTSIKRFPLLKEYNNSLFKMVVTGSDEYDYYLSNARIPKSSFQGGSIGASSDNTSLSVMSYQKNRTLYILNSLPEQSFFKYDGVEITGCGSPQPKFSCATYSTSPITNWVKVIQHRVDFDGNEVASETVTLPVNTGTGLITLRTDSNATNIVSPLNSQVSPQTPVTANSNTLNDLFFTATTTADVTYNAGTNDLSVVASDSNISSDSIGAYVFLGGNATIASASTGWSSANSGFTEYAVLLAVKVKSVSGLNIVLDCLEAKALSQKDRTWQDFTANGATIVAAGVICGFRKMFSVWTSASVQGNYTFTDIRPVFPEATLVTTNATFDLLVSSNVAFAAVSIGGNLGDWYDVNSRKIPISSNYDFGSTREAITSFLGVTSYQDQILWWNDDIIFFSDPNLGGSVEQPSAGSFIRVGDSEYGKVVSCCGTQDYLIVSRERKNYYINGNLATGNYRVQDVAEIEIGAWCNNGTINIKDSVVMINALGVYQISSGGRVSHLSKQIPRNFSSYNTVNLSDHTYDFRIDGYSTFPISAPYPADAGLEIAFDEYREYLVFCQRSTANCPMLVLHTKTGEFYEWVGFGTALRGLAFIRSAMYYGTVDTVGSLAVVKSELSNASTQDYASSHNIRMISTWLTGGEPSLEKQVLQLKLFGLISPNAGAGFNVVHYKDWDGSSKITNAAYAPDSSTQYSHLKRLTSDKALAVSVGFEVNQSGVTFAIESMEVEFNPIQVGMKR